MKPAPPVIRIVLPMPRRQSCDALGANERGEVPIVVAERACDNPGLFSGRGGELELLRHTRIPRRVRRRVWHRLTTLVVVGLLPAVLAFAVAYAMSHSLEVVEVG